MPASRAPHPSSACAASLCFIRFVAARTRIRRPFKIKTCFKDNMSQCSDAAASRTPASQRSGMPSLRALRNHHPHAPCRSASSASLRPAPESADHLRLRHVSRITCLSAVMLQHRERRRLNGRGHARTSHASRASSACTVPPTAFTLPGQGDIPHAPVDMFQG
jgi:hypothetical protein